MNDLKRIVWCSAVLSLLLFNVLAYGNVGPRLISEPDWLSLMAGGALMLAVGPLVNFITLRRLYRSAKRQLTTKEKP
jgi:hypothetical protein